MCGNFNLLEWLSAAEKGASGRSMRCFIFPSVKSSKKDRSLELSNEEEK